MALVFPHIRHISTRQHCMLTLNKTQAVLGMQADFFTTVLVNTATISVTTGWT